MPAKATMVLPFDDRETTTTGLTFVHLKERGRKEGEWKKEEKGWDIGGGR